MGKIIIEVDDILKNEFKAKVASKGKTVKEVLTMLIRKYLGINKWK